MKILRLKNRLAAVALLAAGTCSAVAAELPDVAHAPEKTTAEYVATLFVFMLASFVGLDVIRRVSRLLHTPLMSLTNAISAIAVVGAILIAGRNNGQDANWLNILGMVAIVASVTNIVSGFLITDRMLKMFKKRESKKP